MNRLPAYTLVARNLALVPDDLNELAAPCSACYVNLRNTNKHMAKYPRLGDQVNEALAAGGLKYKPGRVKIRHLLDIIVNDVGYNTIAQDVVKPLNGLRIAPYYGCLIVRPGNGFDNPEYPTSMDRLFRALGAEVVDYPHKAQCCGGHMTQISDKVAYELIRRLLHNAAEYHADVIACVCPMCQLNLDAYQGNVNRHFVVLGDNLSYAMVHFAREPVLRRFQDSENWIKAETSFNRWGGMSVFWTRFLITGIAVPVNLIAGTSGFGIRRFFIYDLIGEAVWIFGYGGLGYLFGTQWEVVSDVLSNISGLSLGLVLLGIGIWLGVRWLKIIEARKAEVPDV